MKRNTTYVVIALAIAGMAAGGYGLYRAGVSRGEQAASAAAAAQPARTERRVLYWHDPMSPGTRFDKPGKSPYMDMDLVPVYADEAAQAGGVGIDPALQQNLGIRTAPVTTGSFGAAVSAVGSVAYDERLVELVQARSNGYLERLYVKAPLDPVRKGQPLADLYVPEWVAAQEEFLAVRRMKDAQLVDAARQRMRIAGMDDAQIGRVEASGKVHPRVTLTAPASGVVGELAVREGATVMAGAPLFRINGLQSVWIDVDVPESAAAQVTRGAPARVTVSALPGKVLAGRVSAVLPQVASETRTLKARIELPNPGLALAPGMFANVELSPPARSGMLTVPTEAVIRTGTRSVVVVALGEGRFKPVDVEPGMESGTRTEIRGPLREGDQVVVSGQFLVDSEASLKGTEGRMQASAHAGHGAAPSAQPAAPVKPKARAASPAAPEAKPKVPAQPGVDHSGHQGAPAPAEAKAQPQPQPAADHSGHEPAVVDEHAGHGSAQ